MAVTIQFLECYKIPNCLHAPPNIVRYYAIRCPMAPIAMKIPCKEITIKIDRVDSVVIWHGKIESGKRIS